MQTFKTLVTSFREMLSLLYLQTKKFVWKGTISTHDINLCLCLCVIISGLMWIFSNKNNNQNIKSNIAIIVKNFIKNWLYVTLFMSSKIRVKVEIIFISHALFFPFFLWVFYSFVHFFSWSVFGSFGFQQHNTKNLE